MAQIIHLQICVRYTYTTFLALEHPVLTVKANELCGLFFVVYRNLYVHLFQSTGM